MQMTRRDYGDDEHPMGVEPLAFERCGIFVVFHQIPVAGEVDDAQPHVVVYHAQPRDTRGRLVERSPDESDGLAELLRETLRAGHECVARGVMTGFDLTNPAAAAGLYTQAALLLIARWPNPFALYTPEQFAELTLHPRAEVLNVYMREAGFPAIWHVEHVTSEGELLRSYEIGLDLWQEMTRRKKSDTARKTGRTGKKGAQVSGASFIALSILEGRREVLATHLPPPEDDDDDVLPATAEMLFDLDDHAASSAPTTPADASDSSRETDASAGSHELTEDEKAALAALSARFSAHHRALRERK